MALNAANFYFFNRLAEPNKPGGITVSKSPQLPDGDFRITEYCWDVSLWFVDRDRFTADERQAAYMAFTEKGGAR